MSSGTVADVIVARLKEWGVQRVFGYSGDGINGLITALDRAGNEPQFFQARHEENAAFMAVGQAKFTGEAGVVISTQGPGAVHILNGLYDAKLDGVPVVAIVGQQKRSVLGAGYMQEVDLPALFADVAGYSQLVSSPEQVPFVIDRAFRTALATQSPSVVILPHDVQTAEASEPSHEHGAINTEPEYRQPRVLPNDADLEAAAEVLSSGRKVAMLVGQGARQAWPSVVALAERLGAGVTCSLLGKPVVDERLPFVAGTMGHLGTTASAFVLGACDTLLIIGSNDPWTEFYPAPGQARAVQIDIDGRFIGNRYPVEVGLVGDAALTLDALLPLITGEPDDSWSAEVTDAVSRWHRIREQRSQVPADPVNPEAVLAALNPRVPTDAQIGLDVGSVVYWYARQLTLPSGVTAHVSGTLASMGCSLPYALAAKSANPDRPTIVLTGDGGFQMTGVAELLTLSREWRRWSDPRFVICVLANQDLAEVTWEQREMETSPRFAASQELPSFPAAEYARLLGLDGETVSDPSQLASAWDRALASDRPYLLEVITDPGVPLLPPFPAGEQKLTGMFEALEAEGESGHHAAELLRVYASHER
ncbi:MULTISPECIES: thiamine pyrophosphate-requiring protein [unclassified Leifsonia]|uniref:thiamine pyrophosphate-requiring protein n=1 Tax=unclassified Leifsonia TaxID=2663824 RepID=UPI0006FE46EA|nr:MULTISPECIES: thiamine pyrophosphate-requiring protein [unclassified Leifsonia]KQX07643.1 thiamine pyrophosphate-binding protein [Leifsonia sp. Root1293]KRA11925.1 thiamine pyrophosphate-binding protein [Leifsonia sp. Root60]